MSKKNKKTSSKQASAKPSAKSVSKRKEEQPTGGGFHTFRESLESIVIAFVLAFLFRTFEAEAFVIPTGSMSPALLGRHKDVDCDECGYRFRITDSEEESDQILLMKARLNAGASSVMIDGHTIIRRDMENIVLGSQVVGGMCPMCRHVMPVRPDLSPGLEEQVDFADTEYQPSYPGDRILVNKYGFTFNDPERWDVVVFKYPGNAEMNYIKRLVGLPGEQLRVFQGDLFTRPLAGEAEFSIQQKPPVKVQAMLQSVHDTDYESANAYQAGWPLRWAATTREGWQVEAEAGEDTVAQTFRVDASDEQDETAWLRYRHLVPDEVDWQVIHDFKKQGDYWQYASREEWQETVGAQLITDFNPYNAKVSRRDTSRNNWGVAEDNQGTQWVGDLAVRCHVNIKEAKGQLTLDLVEAGKHFQAVIDLSSGSAELRIVDGPTGERLDFSGKGETSLNSTGAYTLLFANVHDRLLLWVDDELVTFDNSAYDPEQLFDSREQMIPWASDDDTGDQGDLAPVGIGANGAKLAVTRLEVLRDIYYLASRAGETGPDYEPYKAQFRVNGQTYPELRSLRELMSDPTAWPRFLSRREVSFPIQEEQFFVMGDNSPFSQDARLWSQGSPNGDSSPGGAYLDRRMLIGKAVCVFWPHSWGSIPGLPQLPGFPNFGDMRLVR